MTQEAQMHCRKIGRFTFSGEATAKPTTMDNDMAQKEQSQHSVLKDMWRRIHSHPNCIKT